MIRPLPPGSHKLSHSLRQLDMLCLQRKGQTLCLHFVSVDGDSFTSAITHFGLDTLTW